MSVLNKIAFFLNQRDEVPNQELAEELVKTKNVQGIAEIALNLWSKNKNVQSDCLKVLYEIGYLNPQLIAAYVNDFLKLLTSKNNRLVWGSMIALATVAPYKAREIWDKIGDVKKATERGSVITAVWGIKTLAIVGSSNPTYQKEIVPTLVGILNKCIPRDVPIHAENILLIINKDNKGDFVEVLKSRESELKPSQTTRLRRVLKRVESA